MAKFLAANIRRSLKLDIHLINEGLTCIICGQFVLDAYQTYCGCTFCHECIVVYSTDMDKYCPGNKENCKEEILKLDFNVASSPMLNRSTLKARVHCPNKWCTFITEFAKIEQHFISCLNESIPCPPSDIFEEIDEQPLKKFHNMTEHDNNIIPRTITNAPVEGIGVSIELRTAIIEQKREITAQMEEQNSSFISSLSDKMDNQRSELIALFKEEIEEQKREILMKFADQIKTTNKQGKEIEDLRKEIELFKEESNKRETILEDVKKKLTTLKEELKEVRELSKNTKNSQETSEKKIQSILDKLNENTDAKEVQIVDLKREMKEQFVEQRRIMNKQETEIENQKKVAVEVRKDLEGLKEELGKREKEMEALKKEISEVRECLRNIKNKLEISASLTTKYRNETRSTLTKVKEETDTKESAATQSMNDIRARVDQLADTVVRVKEKVNTNVASFTVNKFSAKKIMKEVILSSYFYSHTNGYKIRIRLYPEGLDEGRGTHLSVFIHICMGEYDDILPWPCRHTFTIGIVNQCDGGTYATETINYATETDNLRHTFYKPINRDNVPLERTKFVSQADLRSVVGLVMDDSIIVRCAISSPP